MVITYSDGFRLLADMLTRITVSEPALSGISLSVFATVPFIVITALGLAAASADAVIETEVVPAGTVTV